MSWQRILRFAKQRQVPVIITDESGEDPMILLSLDALEQALDGAGAGPDLPPVPPTPKSTTPSFVPQVYEDEASFVFAPPTVPSEAPPESAVILEEVPLASNDLGEVALEPPVSTVEEDGLAPINELPSEVPAEPDPIVINDFESPAPAPEPQPPEPRSSDVEIMTPPQMPPEPTPLAISDKKEETKPVAPVSEAETSAPKGMSLEERFFLDF